MHAERSPLVELSPDVFKHIQKMAEEMHVSPQDIIAKSLSLFELAIDSQKSGKIVTLTNATSGITEEKIRL